ncbi:MAG: DNRLRE domain-containing protein [Myxococcota bacterium]
MSIESKSSKPRWILMAAILGALFATTAAQAQTSVTLAPGPEGEDVSYYSFIPLLARGDYPTMYAHTAFSPTGSEHSMSSFIRFDLPANLLTLETPGPGEIVTVTDAFLLMNFAFSFSHEGEPPPPGGELSVHRVNQDWDEATLTYANHPTSDAPLETIIDINNFGPIIFDVTEIVRDWANGDPNYGFELSNPFEDPMGFHTFESPADPILKSQLIVTVPEPGAVAMLASGAAFLGLLGRRRDASRHG